MDTITTDSGKKLKLVEAWTVEPTYVDKDNRWSDKEQDWEDTSTGEINVATNSVPVKRVWVLVEVE